MRINQNPLIKASVAICIIIPIYFLATHSNNDYAEKSPYQPANAITPSLKNTTDNEEIAALSAYLTTVENQQKALQREFKQASDKNQSYGEQLATLQKNPPQLTQSVSPEQLEKRIQEVVAERLASIQTQLLERHGVTPDSTGSVNNTMPFSETFEIGQSKEITSSDQVQWSYPVGYQTKKEDGVIGNLLETGKATNVAFSRAFQAETAAASPQLNSPRDTVTDIQPIPYATFHRDSSMHSAMALTALVGRIERKGNSHDPYRFQVVLSDETLMANGHQLPQLKNAIVSGLAVGDRVMKCVRGKVTSISFNFSDGRTFNQLGTFEKPLAELADPWGNPCVSGKLISNVTEYLASQGIVSGLASVSDTIAQQQQTLNSAGNTQTLSLTGSTGKLAAGSFAAGGLNKMGELLNDRYESHYEAVYAPPGQSVSLLFLQDIAIDYHPSNRKVFYDASVTAITPLD